MAYWLFKTEPGTFSIDDLKASPGATTHWDGIRNYQARNFIRDDIKIGDRVFIYHSSCDEPSITGIAEVTRESYPDSTAFDPLDKHFDSQSDPEAPRWFMVDIRLRKKFRKPVALTLLRQHADGVLRDMQILRRGNRLSITPITKQQWDFIEALAR